MDACFLESFIAFGLLKREFMPIAWLRFYNTLLTRERKQLIIHNVQIQMNIKNRIGTHGASFPFLFTLLSVKNMNYQL